MKNFEGKVAAITGAGSGIGRALALELARRGADVALSDVNETGLAETVDQVKRARSSAQVTSAKVDVAERDAVYAWAEAVIRDHRRCNLVINNAGVAYAATVEGAEYENLEWIVGINFWGVVYGTKAFLPHLRASGEGHVVNVSSLFGIVSVPGQSAYNATKFAVRGFTEALRAELEMMGAPVSATCVHPGGIRTNIARAARAHESLRDLGADPVESGARFEKLLRTSPDEAARCILQAVEKNARRVLVGNDAKLLDAVQRVLPTAYHDLVMRSMRRALAPGS